MSNPVLEVNGARLELDASGAAYWRDGKALLVADIHFEKASSFGPSKQMLPPYDTLENLKRLRRVIDRFQPDMIVALGDSFHDVGAYDRLTDEELSGIRALTFACDWHWILGNHDPEVPDHLGGQMALEIALGPLVLRHEPQPAPAPGEVAGHLHPVAIARARGRGLRRRAFICDGSRLILPSFGALTGGLNVGDPAFADLLPGSFHAWMIGHETIRAVPSKNLFLGGR